MTFLGEDPLRVAGEQGIVDDPDKWNTAAAEQLSGYPFDDLANERTLSFKALGIKWIVRADISSRSAVLAAERLAAAAQILLVELADEDLCLMPIDIDVTVTTVADPESDVADRVNWKPTSSGRTWTLQLTEITEAVDDPHDIATELLVAVSILLMDASLVRSSAYHEALERAFQRGLGHKLMFGRPYDELRIAFEDSSLRAGIGVDCRRSGSYETWEPIQAEELSWRDGPGPGYSEAKAVENARLRSERLVHLFLDN